MLFITYHANDDLVELCFRMGSQFMMGISTSFLLISFATILNHFKPDLYLEFSLRWKHKIAVPTLLVLFVLTEQLVHYSCPENFVDCQVFKFRRFIIIPSTIASFVCQLIVIIDIIFPWKHIYSTLRRFIRPNQLAPMNDGDLEIVSLPGSASHQPSSATPQLDQHLVNIFLFIYVLLVKFYLIEELPFTEADFPENWILDFLLLQCDGVPPEPPGLAGGLLLCPARGPLLASLHGSYPHHLDCQE